MNERTKQLWKESQQWNGSDDGRGGLKILESVEKFAELIGRECLTLADSIRDGLDEDGEKQQALGAAWVGLAIERHFMIDSNERKYMTTDPEPEAKYDPVWCIEYCKSYAEQLRDKTRANRAVHAAECIEYLLSLANKEWVSLTDEEISECAMQGYASEMAKAIITGVVKVGDANIQIAKAVETKLKEKNS